MHQTAVQIAHSGQSHKLAEFMGISHTAQQLPWMVKLNSGISQVVDALKDSGLPILDEQALRAELIGNVWVTAMDAEERLSAI